MPGADSPIRLLHFADVHFGVETYGRYDPATGLSTRLIDFRNALLAGIKQALDEGVEIALFAGDAYKARDPSQTHQREFAACLRVLTAAGVPVVLLTGNHDIPNTKGKANAIEIYEAVCGERLTVLDRRTVTTVETSRGRALQIAAIPYLTKSLVLAREEKAEMGVQETAQAVAAKYEEAIETAAAQCALNPDLPTVLMGHFTVATAQIGLTQAGYLAGEPQVAKESLRRSEFDYVALGHIHRFQDLNAGSQPPLVYCGSIERIDFGERAEAKGVVVTEVSRGHAEYRFIETPSRPFLEIAIDTTKGADGEVSDPTDKILSELAKHDLTQAVVKLVYKVRPEDAPQLRERDIRQALQSAFMVVSQQREVVGSDKAAMVRSKLLKESLMPLDALSTYIDSKDHLAKRKADLMAKAQVLWDEIVVDETARS
jgi:DNA repair protein SbcD/Mre11